MRSRRKHQRGSAVVEAALLFPLLLLVAFGTMDFSRVFYTAIAAANAAEAGALYGVQSGKSSDFTGMQNTAVNDGNVPGLTAAASQFCHCEDGSNVSCSGSCGSQGKPLVYVHVTTQATFNTLVTYPLIPSSVNVRGKAVMRAK